jgi:RNA polymerase primary sigma factor
MRTDPVLEAYLHDIRETPLLTPEHEQELARRITRGDSEARDHLIRANLRLVVKIAGGYVARGLPLQDLIEEGNLGLLRAVEGYDPGLGTRFSTYASHWIKQAIRRGLVNTARTVRLPAYTEKLLDKWRRAGASLRSELGREPTEDEVGRRLGLPRKKVNIIKEALRIHNGGPQGVPDGAGASIEDQLPDGRPNALDAALVAADERREILTLLGALDERGAAVLRLHFGLDGEEPLTLKEIGARLGLTQEGVRQIEKRALADLARRVRPDGPHAEGEDGSRGGLSGLQGIVRKRGRSGG